MLNDWYKVWENKVDVEIARPIACEILGTCASTRSEGLLGVAGALGHESFGLAAELALAAWTECAPKYGWVPTRDLRDMQRQDLWDKYFLVCAEAESLLRGGWFPGDKR